MTTAKVAPLEIGAQIHVQTGRDLRVFQGRQQRRDGVLTTVKRGPPASTAPAKPASDDEIRTLRREKAKLRRELEVAQLAIDLILPTASTVTLNLFLAEFAKTLAPDDHVVMVLDGAGWHAAAALAVPDNITLVPPPYSPERNPVERIWLHPRERFLSIQVWPDQNAIIDACCDAWNALAADARRIVSLAFYPWIEKVIS